MTNQISNLLQIRRIHAVCSAQFTSKRDFISNACPRPAYGTAIGIHILPLDFLHKILYNESGRTILFGFPIISIQKAAYQAAKVQEGEFYGQHDEHRKGAPPGHADVPAGKGSGRMRRRGRTPSALRLGSRALGFLMVGHTLILLALCDFAARLHAGVTIEPLLYMEEFLRSVAVSFPLLWGFGLYFDYWEKRK